MATILLDIIPRLLLSQPSTISASCGLANVRTGISYDIICKTLLRSFQYIPGHSGSLLVLGANSSHTFSLREEKLRIRP